MKPGLSVGLHHSLSLRISPSLTVPEVSPAFAGFTDMPPVFATAYMVGFIEWACVEALRPFLEPNERTVGTHVDVSHVAATPVGMTATAAVELVAIEGRYAKLELLPSATKVTILKSGLLGRDAEGEAAPTDASADKKPSKPATD